MHPRAGSTFNGSCSPGDRAVIVAADNGPARPSEMQIAVDLAKLERVMVVFSLEAGVERAALRIARSVCVSSYRRVPVAAADSEST